MGNNQESFLRKYGFKAQLRTILAVLIITPILILGVYMYMAAKKNLIAQTQMAIQGNIDVITTALENNCKIENDVIKFFTYEENFRKVLERANSNPYALTEELNDEIEPLIWYYQGSDMNLKSIHIYSDLLPKDHIGDFLSIPETDLEKKWYDYCRAEYSTMWVCDKEGGVYLIKALLDSATSSRLIGIVVLEINTSNFFSMINQASYLDNGVLIVDYDQNVILNKNIEDSTLDEQIKNDAISYDSNFSEDTFITTDSYFMAVSRKLDNDWRLFYYVDRKTIGADVISLLINDIIMAIVLFAVVYFVASIYATRRSAQITHLNEMANRIKSRDFNVTDDIEFKDEIGLLSASMVDMAKQLEEMVKEINARNVQDLLMKESDIHYREWLFDFVVEKNNDILAVLGTDEYEPSFITSNVDVVLGIPIEEMKSDIRNIDKAVISSGVEGQTLSSLIASSMTTGEALALDEIEFENKKTNEHLYYRGVIVCTIDDGGKRMAIALYDRTQEYKRNHQLQEALNAAETANRAKTSFLANMSHDFRTPMNAITGFNLLIDKHAEEADKVREYTHKISLASQNLLSLLNDVLDMSKIESGKTTLDIKEMPIGLLLEEINSVISFQAKAKNQEYELKVESLQHDVFMGDKQRINEILMNILGNAVKYTPEGGKIEFIINESPSSSEGFQNVKFTIKDNGIGMKAEYKDKIFDAFSREEKGATKTIQGTGLGMAITKSLVELMGGTIRVESEEGKGSTFIVNLRLKAVEVDNVDFWKAHGISRMLVVNKDEKVDEAYKKSFDNSIDTENIEVKKAWTGFEAIKAVDELAEKSSYFDIIIVDETIEDMKPAELIKSIRGKDKRNNSLILAVTDNYDMVEDELRAAGCNEILQKPVFASILMEIIDDIMKRSSTQEEEVKNPLEGMRFLAAEDNDINADILTELMSMEGATVTRGCNGQEVVEMFKNAQEGDYDMILMDIQMPVMNGYEAAAAIRALGTDWSQRIPIIAMTANAYADDVQQAFDAGMNAHVSKPIDIRVVEKTILEFKNL
ncbi:response regulator [Butyrivibrio sp. YAB3001]|uniref:response regulator n=1 Tax=Butyrivibrio sp. YAB3001 TaxID=1520812 RepID=UPI0008F666E7|nr:response regulator [Butyrivibrio sp. YAB3001]SFC89003.1 Response regulator receiver domain-containing protein [Butyrivibrio sp. YAB3001]